MKNIDKNLQRSKQSDGTLIYLLLLLLVAVLIGCGIWYHIESQKPKEQVYDYVAELGKFDNHPTAEVVSKLISGNRSRLKTVERVLDGRMRGRKLKASEKAEVKTELNNINRKLDGTVQEFKLKELQKNNPEILATIYSQLYEQGKILTRLKAKTAVNRPYKEVWNQLNEIQPKWEIDSVEEEEIKKKMNGWITGWYDQAMERLWNTQRIKKLTEYIKPLYVKGKDVKRNFSPADVDIFRKNFTFENDDDTDLSQPLQIEFKGYDGFVNSKDIEDTEEGKETFGITEATRIHELGTKDAMGEKYDWVKVIGKNYRGIKIRLKKQLFFNRLGYEEWINQAKKEEGVESRVYYDICFEEVVETIAHELAHAVINSIKGNYKGQEGGGHGKLFYDYMKEIEKMIRETPEYPTFEKWWDKTDK